MLFFSFAGVCSVSENRLAPTQRTNLYVVPVLSQVTQDGHEMDSVGHLANPHTCETDLQDTNHVPSDEDRAPPPASPHSEHEVEINVPNQSANSYVTAPVEVAQNEQGMDRVVEHGNSNVNTPIVEPGQSANVPPTSEGNAQPEQDEQERTVAPPDQDHTLSPNTGETTTNNQLGDGVGDGSAQPQTHDGVSPTLDKEKHFVRPLKARFVRRHQSLPDNTLPMSWPRSGGRFLFDEEQQGKPRRGSRSSDDDPGVHRSRKPPPSPLTHTSLKSSRSAIKNRRTSTASVSSRRQSQAEDGEDQVLLEDPPKTPKTSSHPSRRQSKSENDEKTNLLKEQSPVDDEHPTISDGHTSDDS